MKAALFDAWVEALESGKYEQRQGSLYGKDTEGQETYCCLGLLACVAEAQEPIVAQVDWREYNELTGVYAPGRYPHTDDKESDPGLTLAELLELSSRDLTNELDSSLHDELIHKNDERRWSFERIAKWLRANRDWIVTDLPKDDGRLK